MQNLDFFYETPLKTIKFINRKQFVSNQKTLIIGSPQSGKTSLMCEYLAQYKAEERLYINLKDLRADPLNLLTDLSEFLAAHPSLKALGVDNLSSQNEAEILKKIDTSTLETIIIATDQRSFRFENFSVLELGYLDYEEFILFFKKNLDANFLFSHFLAHGGAIKCAFLDASEVSESLQNDLKKELSPVNLNIIKECASKCHDTVSAFEIYKILKQSVKISKDSVYAGLNELENSGFIITLPKFNEPNATKKLYFRNFALRNTLSAKKDFTATFANVILCELLKFKDEIFYTKELDFFLIKRKLTVLCIPFSASEIIFLKFKKLHPLLKNLNVSRLQVISVANSGEMSIEGIKCEILPFSRWALGI
ncbi:ATP-binding protein [Campylobacter curvus]|uniref:ATPase, AAA family n=1 Tax=Campylobacter curvus (strain 525.92) TaxID=360105 RepID=A7H114_CAMC5|nr:ATP-binding protein [Campylobacter curvus]EAT99408.1 ATPase, AAA family [Campylobacter curvus 525.92]